MPPNRLAWLVGQFYFLFSWSLPHMLPTVFGDLLPMNLMHNSSYVMLVLATPLQFWVGWRFYKGFWDGIKAKASNMDTLIAIGTTAAYLYSAAVTIAPGFFPFNSVYFETSAVIITLILVGRLLETRTKEKASYAVRKLLDLRPSMAKIVRPIKNSSGQVVEQEVQVPVEEIQEGDIMIIRPGEKIPTDGLVVDTGFFNTPFAPAATNSLISLSVMEDAVNMTIFSDFNKLSSLFNLWRTSNPCSHTANI